VNSSIIEPTCTFPTILKITWSALIAFKRRLTHTAYKLNKTGQHAARCPVLMGPYSSNQLSHQSRL